MTTTTTTTTRLRRGGCGSMLLLHKVLLRQRHSQQQCILVLILMVVVMWSSSSSSSVVAFSFQHQNKKSPFFSAAAVKPSAGEEVRNHDTTRAVPKAKTSSTKRTTTTSMSTCTNWEKTLQSAVLAVTIAASVWTSSFSSSFLQPPSALAADSAKIVTCLVSKCPKQLGECILNPKCLLNVACINTCNGRPDELDCQINCGTLFENDVVGDFNKCAVSDMSCVPQQQDDGSYPVPAQSQVVPAFDTKLFTGRWYISAGQNTLFDTFPCQVHFFSPTGNNKFVGKLNWRVEEPDGEFFTRDALQAFVQDPQMPAHLINHDNEYLHYKDDWWIIDYEYDNNEKNVPPFAFVYYRGSNDAWDGYGGVVIYTRDAALPRSLYPRLREAAKKVNFDFDKDFTVVDNSCPTQLSEGEKVLLREKFAGKVVLQTEQQLQAQAVRLRGNAVNSVKAQKIFFENGLEVTQKAFQYLEQTAKDFEEEVVSDALKVEQEVVKDVFQSAQQQR